jgi:hypothetical protein
VADRGRGACPNRPLSSARVGSCASTGRAWHLWAAQYFQEVKAGSLGAQLLPRLLDPATSNIADSNIAVPPRLTGQEDKRLRHEAQAAQRQEEARSRREAARQEISAAYREVVIEQSAAEAAEAAPPPTAPAVPTESHSEAVARMMRERHEAREQMQREVAELQGRAAARRAAAASSGRTTGTAAAAAPVYDRSLFQRPLLPAEPTVPPPAADAARAAAVGAGKSAPARDAWAWAQQREAPASGEAAAAAVLE